MKCLSIWDPWATLIAIGAKGYETRSWSPPDALLGQRIAIHASRARQGLALLATDRAFGIAVWDAFRAAGITVRDPFAPGCIIATAELALVIDTDGMIGREVLPTEKRFGDWSPGRKAWRLVDVRKTWPIPLRGMQGLFDLPNHIAQQVA
jgi:activating signal cointegrator 1